MKYQTIRTIGLFLFIMTVLLSCGGIEFTKDINNQSSYKIRVVNINRAFGTTPAYAFDSFILNPSESRRIETGGPHDIPGQCSGYGDSLAIRIISETNNLKLNINPDDNSSWKFSSGGNKTKGEFRRCVLTIRNEDVVSE